MNRATLFLAALIILVGSAVSQTSEKEAVKIPPENYIKGHATGDGEFMKKAFHTEGNLIWIRDGKYTTRSFAEFIAGFTGKPAVDEDKRKRAIEAIDVSGSAAVARIVLDYPAVKVCRLYDAA